MAALMHKTGASEELAQVYLDRRPLEADQVSRVAELVDAAGGRRWAAGEAELRLQTAASHLRAVHPEAQAADELRELTQLVVRRDH